MLVSQKKLSSMVRTALSEIKLNIPNDSKALCTYKGRPQPHSKIIGHYKARKASLLSSFDASDVNNPKNPGAKEKYGPIIKQRIEQLDKKLVPIYADLGKNPPELTFDQVQEGWNSAISYAENDLCSMTGLPADEGMYYTPKHYKLIKTKQTGKRLADYLRCMRNAYMKTNFSCPMPYTEYFKTAEQHEAFLIWALNCNDAGSSAMWRGKDYAPEIAKLAKEKGFVEPEEGVEHTKIDNPVMSEVWKFPYCHVFLYSEVHNSVQFGDEGIIFQQLGMPGYASGDMGSFLVTADPNDPPPEEEGDDGSDASASASVGLASGKAAKVTSDLKVTESIDRDRWKKLAGI